MVESSLVEASEFRDKFSYVKCSLGRARHVTVNVPGVSRWSPHDVTHALGPINLPRNHSPENPAAVTTLSLILEQTVNWGCQMPRQGGRDRAVLAVPLSTPTAVQAVSLQAEQGMEKGNSPLEELKAAVEHGRRTRAHPGRDGLERWKFEHQGLIYLTDSTCSQVVTSWRLDDTTNTVLYLPDENISSRTVLIVDSSGSMRAPDVPGYRSRTQAVYASLVRDFVRPQIARNSTTGTASTTQGASGPRVHDQVISLIEMGEQATVIFDRVPINQDLLRILMRRGSSYARSHGFYLPALESCWIRTQIKTFDCLSCF